MAAIYEVGDGYANALVQAAIDLVPGNLLGQGFQDINVYPKAAGYVDGALDGSTGFTNASAADCIRYNAMVAHGGVRGAGIVMDVGAATANKFITCAYSKVNGFCLMSSTGTGVSTESILNPAGKRNTFSSNIFYNYPSAATFAAIRLGVAVGAPGTLIYNNQFLMTNNNKGYVTIQIGTLADPIEIHNNVAIGGATGFNGFTAAYQNLSNNFGSGASIAHNCFTGFAGANCTFNYNVSTDDSAGLYGGVGNLASVVKGDQTVNSAAGTEDCRPKKILDADLNVIWTSVLDRAGQNNSALFTTDCAGNTYTSWYTGCFEITPIVMNPTFYDVGDGKPLATIQAAIDLVPGVFTGQNVHAVRVYDKVGGYAEPPDLSAGFTLASAYNYLDVGAAVPHEGERGHGIVVDVGEVASGTHVPVGAWARFHGFCITQSSFFNGPNICIKLAGRSRAFDNILYDIYSKASVDSNYGIRLDAAGACAYNNQVLLQVNGSKWGIYVSVAGTSAARSQIHSNSCYSSAELGTGIRLAAAIDYVDLSDNYCGGYTTGFLIAANANGTFNYNVSVDGTAGLYGGVGNLTGMAPADQFVDVGAGTENLHLKAGSACIRAGQDNSAFFTTDCNARTRVDWNTGAHETLLVPFACSCEGVGDLGAALSVRRSFAARAEGVGTLDAALSVRRGFACGAEGIGTLGAALGVRRAFSAAAEGVGTLDAALAVRRAFAAAAEGVGDLGAALSVLRAFAARAEGIGTLDAALSVIRAGSVHSIRGTPKKQFTIGWDEDRGLREVGSELALFDRVSGQKTLSQILHGATERFFLADPSADLGNLRVRTVAGDGSHNFTFAVPWDFGALVSAEVIGIPAATFDDQAIWLSASYGGVGEAYAAHAEADDAQVFSGVQDAFFVIDVAGILSSLAAGDLVGVNVSHQGIGTSVHYVGVRLRYNRG